MKRRFAIGTTNKSKIAEINSIVMEMGYSMVAAPSLYVPEIGNTFEENAIIKAIAYAKASGIPTIAEDSGLSVEALNGLPGPHSARFYECIIEDLKVVEAPDENPTGTQKDVDRKNYNRVLAMMNGVKNRNASFDVSLAVCNPDGEVLFSSVSSVTGKISKTAVGTNGFGYDPIFIGDDTYGRTYGQIDSLRKNLRSHRREVLRHFRLWLS